MLIRRVMTMQSNAEDMKKPWEIFSALREAAGKIVPIDEADIYLIDSNSEKFITVSEEKSRWLDNRMVNFLEEGIVDWVIEEEHAVVIDDLEHVTAAEDQDDERNFILIPFLFAGSGRGIFVIYTPKPKRDFTGWDLEQLTRLSNNDAGGVTGQKTIKTVEIFSSAG